MDPLVLVLLVLHQDLLDLVLLALLEHLWVPENLEVLELQ
jgi:hypothetical protein